MTSTPQQIVARLERVCADYQRLSVDVAAAQRTLMRILSAVEQADANCNAIMDELREYVDSGRQRQD